MPTRWVGIDEAGYGPNLGPLVMTAVIAIAPDDRPPDLWADLASTVARAGGDPNKLWVDDSKKLYRPGLGRERLDTTCQAVVEEVSKGVVPAALGEFLALLGAGSLEDAELSPWLADGDHPLPSPTRKHDRPFQGAVWRVETVRSIIIGPARFNAGLDRHESKAKVHFEAFSVLMGHIWDRAGDGTVVHVRGDKHGGRHFYYEPLLDIFPEAWIDRGPEGPALSRYTIRDRDRRIELSLMPRADSGDGFVALASVVSKALREYWMDIFNAHWRTRLPDLKPTAGYPMDAVRFRSAIEPLCEECGLKLRDWWRAK